MPRLPIRMYQSGASSEGPLTTALGFLDLRLELAELGPEAFNPSTELLRFLVLFGLDVLLEGSVRSFESFLAHSKFTLKSTELLQTALEAILMLTLGTSETLLFRQNFVLQHE